MSYILQSSMESRKQTHMNEIKKIQYTIDELEKLKEDQYKKRCSEHQAKFHTTNDFFLIFPLIITRLV